jgi:Ca2+-transporting ATPase
MYLIVSTPQLARSQMASQGLRVLGLAMKQTSKEEFDRIEGDSMPEDKFVFIGLVGLIDPPRKGVNISVQQCKKAGIKVVMITGDHIATATSIATDLGIIEPDNPAEV